MKLKYYRVTCKCGHVGIKRFIRIMFPVEAENGREAASIARQLPRVKHDHKDAILDCKEIDYEEYIILQKINRHDPYLCCKCVQEQNLTPEIMQRSEKEIGVQKHYEDDDRSSRIIYKTKKTVDYIKSLLTDYEFELDLEEAI